MKTKRAQRPKYRSVAEFAAKRNLRDWELAIMLGVGRSQATKLRRGKKYRSLTEPLKVAKVCDIPIEALAPSEAA
jgi:transcriptional regulator with XRE-family HTH domain